MKRILAGLTKLSKEMKKRGLQPHTVDLDKLKEESQEEDVERPLYQAIPTPIPGTWVEEDGELIKTSKD